MKNFINIVVVALLVYVGSWFFVYKTGINVLSVQSEDTIPAMFLPITILKSGTLYADEYYYKLLQKYPNPDDKSFVKGLTPFYFKKIQVPNCVDAELQINKIFTAAQPIKVSKCVHYISAFPIISGLLAVPVYAAAIFSGLPLSWETILILAHIASALIVALSGGFLFILLKKYFDIPESKAYIVTNIYLFATINYALVSQALWQHGSLELFIILGLLFLFKSFNSLHYKMPNLFFSSLFFGISILSRPTAAIALPFLFLLILEKLTDLPFEHYSNFRLSSVFLLIRNSIKPTLVFILGLVPVFAFFWWYNQTFFFNIENQGYSSQLFTSWLSRFPEGILGIWFSPSKGILVYSPIFVFSFIGLLVAFKKFGVRESLRYLVFFGIVIVHTFIVSRWKHWYGGWSFGYRMSADIIPYLVLLIVPFIKSTIYDRNKDVLALFFALSVVIQIYGMVFFDGVWHAAYDKGFTNTSWLWSIRDSEIVFNMRRVLVKLNILDRACNNCLPKITP